MAVPGVELLSEETKSGGFPELMTSKGAALILGLLRGGDRYDLLLVIHQPQSSGFNFPKSDESDAEPFKL